MTEAKPKWARRLKTTGVILLVIALILGAIYGVLYFIGYVSFSGMPISIKNGFSDELTEMLKNDYDITIADNVTFIEGEYITGIMGTNLYILFELDAVPGEKEETENYSEFESNIYNIIPPDIYKESLATVKHKYIEEYGYDFKHIYLYNKRTSLDWFDALFTTEIIDGKIYCVFFSSGVNDIIR